MRAGALLALFLLGVPVMCAMAVSALWVGRHGKMPDGVRTPAALALRITSVAAIVYVVGLMVWAALLTFVQSRGGGSGLWSMHVGGGVVCLAVGFLPMWLAETWACKWLFGSVRHHEFC